MKNMVIKVVGAADGETMLFLHGSRAPTREEWDACMATLASMATAGTLAKLRVLVVSDGGGPDAVMRGKLQALFKEQGYSTKTSVVLSGGMLARGMVTAVSWFNPNLKSFAPNGFAAALEYLGLSHGAQRLLRELSNMERELGHSRCLALVRGSSITAEL